MTIVADAWRGLLGNVFPSLRVCLRVGRDGSVASAGLTPDGPIVYSYWQSIVRPGSGRGGVATGTRYNTFPSRVTGSAMNP